MKERKGVVYVAVWERFSISEDKGRSMRHECMSVDCVAL